MFAAAPVNTLIAADNSWLLWAVILAGVALSIYLEQRVRWAARLSGPVVALILAMLLSNLRVMPADAPTYNLIWDYLVPLAIPLLLFRANLFHIARTTGSMFLAFHISALGTMIGAIVATVAFGQVLPSPAKLAAIMTGSYTGGSVNFFALRNSYSVPEELTAPLLVADNFIMAGIFVLLFSLAASRWMRRHFPHPHSLGDERQAQALAAEHWKRKEISLLDIAKALAVAFVLAAAAKEISDLANSKLGGGMARAVLGNLYIWLTGLTVAVATLFPRAIEEIHGSEELGGYLLYIFLFAIGLPADLMQVLTKVPLMFLFCLVIALVNLVFTLIVGRLLHLGLEELLLAVNATLGGAPSAAAMAVARGWPKLVLPAVLVGIWGYVIGTLLGIVIGQLLLGWWPN